MDSLGSYTATQTTTQHFLEIPIGADPLSLLNLISGIKKIIDEGKGLSAGYPEFGKRIADIEVLLLILQETFNTVVRYGRLPDSIIAAAQACRNRFKDVANILHGLEAMQKVPNIQMTMGEHTVRTLDGVEYRTFRDSVLLLRDLASDLKMDNQLREMSINVVKLVASEFDNESATVPVSEPEDKHTATDWDPQRHTKKAHVAVETPVHTNTEERRKISKILVTLAQWNFTVDVTLVLEQPRGLRYIPVRAKADTGCDENLISTEVLHRANIQESQCEILDEGIELTGIGDTPHILERKITVTWYLNRGMKSRVADFYVVESDWFDIILGAETLGAPKKTAFPLQKPWQSKDQQKKEDAEHEAIKDDAQKAEKEQGKAAIASIIEKRTPNKSISTQPPGGNTSTDATSITTSSTSASQDTASPQDNHSQGNPPASGP